MHGRFVSLAGRLAARGFLAFAGLLLFSALATNAEAAASNNVDTDTVVVSTSSVVARDSSPETQASRPEAEESYDEDEEPVVDSVAPNAVLGPPNVGYRDFSYGNTVTPAPTGEKPESKLWWNDGYWWGSLWNTSSNRYTIHRFENNSWVNTGTAIDTRASSKGDALWDGTHLYIASHVFTTSPGSSSSGNGRLFRYSYNSGSNTYTLDSGFPVNVNSSKSEALVLDKDSNGKLWVTWVEGGKVKVNRTVGSDLTWGQPFDLPVQGSNTNSDDISSLAPMAGNRIGLMWSNQRDKKMYFAVHLDGAADTQWEPREDALADASLGAVADDHINLKLACDGSGTLYAATKTSLEGSDPLVYILRRQPTGVWSRHRFGTGNENHTRPIICLDADAGVMYVFAQSNRSGREVIYMKSSSTANLTFPSGLGTPVIDSPSDTHVNDPSSKKGCVGGATGLLVVASDEGTHYYFHNFFDLGGGTLPVIASFNPSSGVPGTEVTITGTRLSGATQVTFNNTPASTFFVDSDVRIRAIVPPAATTGRIRVTTPGGVGQSASDFTVTTPPSPPSIASFSPSSGPVGQVVTITGSGFTGTSAVEFGGVAAAVFTVDNNAQIRATVPLGAVTGRIQVTNAAGSDESSEDFVVTPGPTTLVLPPIHDARVKSSSPTSNYGQDSLLRIRFGDVSYHSYFKFAVSGLSGPLQEAKLRLFCTDGTDDGGTVHLVSNDYLGTSTPWTENGLNWDNAPAIPNPSLDSAGPVTTGTWVELDVTAAIIGDGTYSFALKSTSDNSGYYSSDEGSHPPELVLSVASSIHGAQTLAAQVPIEIGPVVLRQNQPNPFRGSTSVSLDLPAAAPVELLIYDIRGREIRRLVDGWLPPGRHSATWDSRDRSGFLVPSGMYFLQLKTPTRTQSLKMLLVR